jgi:hypothetical protein
LKAKTTAVKGYLWANFRGKGARKLVENRIKIGAKTSLLGLVCGLVSWTDVEDDRGLHLSDIKKKEGKVRVRSACRPGTRRHTHVRGHGWAAPGRSCLFFYSFVFLLF